MRLKPRPAPCCHPGCTVQGRFPVEDSLWICTQHLIQRSRKNQDVDLGHHGREQMEEISDGTTSAIRRPG
jgi:hypothetical protein